MFLSLFIHVHVKMSKSGCYFDVLVLGNFFLIFTEYRKPTYFRG